MTKIYVHKCGHSGRIDMILGNTVFIGMRYLALEDKPWPSGRIVAYGLTVNSAYRRARRIQRRKAARTKRREAALERWPYLLVAVYTEAGERVQ